MINASLKSGTNISQIWNRFSSSVQAPKIIPFVFLILFTRKTALSGEHGESKSSHDDHILFGFAIFLAATYSFPDQ
jgi:hypothetical protein